MAGYIQPPAGGCFAFERITGLASFPHDRLSRAELLAAVKEIVTS